MRLVIADVDEGVYDEHRQIMVVPLGLCEQERAAMVLDLMRERR